MNLIKHYIFLYLLASTAIEAAPIILPTQPAEYTYQILGTIDLVTGQLDWITTTTSTVQLSEIETATSADIPFTLVLRDTTGSFFNTNIMLDTGELIFTTTAGLEQALLQGTREALVVSPLPLAALQADNDTAVRGDGAVDLQMGTTSSMQTASGEYSVITGGNYNSASGAYSVDSGGLSNTISGLYATNSGGSSNLITGSYSSSSAGLLNTITSNFSSIITASACTVEGDFSTILSGQSNIITSSAYNYIAGGDFNTISGQASCIVAGYLNTESGIDYAAILAGYNNQPILQNVIAMFAGQNNIGESTCMASQSSNTRTGYYGIITGGYYNFLNASASSILSGSGNKSRIFNDCIMGGVNGFSGGGIGGMFIGSGINGTVSGDGSILAGFNNTSNGIYATTINGFFNTSSGFIGSGAHNNVSLQEGYQSVMSGSNNIMSTAGTIMGGQTNSSTSGIECFIGGGTYNSTGHTATTIITGSNNITSSFLSIIANGRSNNNLSGLPYGIALMNGLSNNTNSNYTGLLSGSNNSITGSLSSILNGVNNSVSSTEAFIGTGIFNTLSNNYAGILTGSHNSCTNSSAAIIAGMDNSSFSNAGTIIKSGFYNTVSGTYAGILTGSGNTCSTSYSAILGGQNNNSGTLNSAALAGGSGTFSRIGSFIWTDNSLTNTQLYNSANNQWMVKASAGTHLYTNSLATTGVYLAPGSNAWSNLSDSSAKTNVTGVDHLTTLTLLADLPITSWNLISQDPSFVHIGPFAQDFYNLFGYGESPCSICVSDALGVLFSAFNGLYQIYQEDAAASKNLYHRINDIKSIITRFNRQKVEYSLEKNLN